MIPQGWTIGRIGGIAIKIHASLIAVALLVTYILATQILPYAAPGNSVVLYWIVGLFTSSIFIGSILWHEMAHSVVAQFYHIPVAQIVLYLFGGVAQITRDPERPAQEFWIAIAGPLSSLVLAVTFGAFSVLPGIGGAACGWLAVTNLTLALFNLLLPGFPLDGGRVLRSILWRIGGSYRKATRQASRVGQVVAGLFVVLAIAMMGGSFFNGLWFLMIGAFLYSAASTSYQMASGPSLPMGTPVRRVMRFNVPIIEPTLPLAILAWRYLDHARDQAFPVMQNGDLVGLVTAVEVDKIPRLDWGKVRVEQTMLRRESLAVVAADDDLETALGALESKGMNHAPVFEAGQFVGMLNRRDIVYRT